MSDEKEPEVPQVAAPSDEPVTEKPAKGGDWVSLVKVPSKPLRRTHLLVGALCALVGVGFVAQIQQHSTDQFSQLREDDLVRLLDEVNKQSDDLDRTEQDLAAQKTQLSSDSDKQSVARDVAKQRVASEEILAGTVPVHGPGIMITIADPSNKVPSSALLNVLEELRNAGAEAIEINGIRMGTSSWFDQVSGQVVVDGQQLSPPYTWQAIGDPATLDVALNIYGGAVSVLRSAGGTTTIRQVDDLQIESVTSPATPTYATPAPVDPATH